ncbi:MAG TPA: outer membrane beta-barrel protein [Candidatus Sulfotelmatobacter sp.]|nr:outer membrane beta-barrel protein [Candidatus Sulfotelmatobacter sp.]
MRKLALLAPVLAVLFSCHFATAQQGDVFIGGGTLLSSSSSSTSGNGFPAEKGGLYINLGGDVVFHKNFGILVETAWRATQGSYAGVNSGLNYRPILTDFNALYQPHLGKKVGLDLMAGIGAADTRLYPLGASAPGYANYLSTNHFMEHLGGGIRYYVWQHVFVRPEIHYYHIQNNNSFTDNGYFSSNNVFRAGASVGYTFGGSQ